MIFRVLLLSGILFSASAVAMAAGTTEIQQKVAQLDAQSKSLLGVSLNALRYLVEADGNSFLHLGHLKESGEILYIQELEAKGYVKSEVVQSLPDGSQTKETFLKVIPIGSGVELKQCVLALHDNPAMPGKAARRP